MCANVEEKFKAYHKHRELLVSAIFQTARQLDRTILTLSAGAFGISLVFMKEVIPPGKPPLEIDLLRIAWISFSGSILSTLISFFTSLWACSNGIVKLDVDYLGDGEDKLFCLRKTRLPIWLTNLLNLGSIVLFTSGIFFLSKFAYSNLLQMGGK